MIDHQFIIRIEHVEHHVGDGNLLHHRLRYFLSSETLLNLCKRQRSPRTRGCLWTMPRHNLAIQDEITLKCAQRVGKLWKRLSYFIECASIEANFPIRNVSLCANAIVFIFYLGVLEVSERLFSGFRGT